MKVKVITFIILSLFLFVGCNNQNKKDNNTKRYKKEIAVLKFVTHPALDEMENAFVNHLDSLLKSNDSLKGYFIKCYNANSSSTSANTIAKSFEYKNIALVFTIATPAAIEVANIPSDILHIYGAVADPVGAKIIPSKRSTGIQNSGESIIKEALIFIKSIFGEDVNIGTIYNPKEQNSIYVQDVIKKVGAELKLTVKQATTESTSQLNGITNSLCHDVDVIYSANDNTVNSGVSTITSVTSQYKKPFVIGDLSTLKDGALFAIGLEYSSMGYDLAEMSYHVILENSIKSYPPQGAPKPEIWMNSKIGKELEFVLNDSLKEHFNVNIK